MDCGRLGHIDPSLDFFFEGYQKENVYESNTHTFNERRHGIYRGKYCQR